MSKIIREFRRENLPFATAGTVTTETSSSAGTQSQSTATTKHPNGGRAVSSSGTPITPDGTSTGATTGNTGQSTSGGNDQ